MLFRFSFLMQLFQFTNTNSNINFSNSVSTDTYFYPSHFINEVNSLSNTYIVNILTHDDDTWCAWQLSKGILLQAKTEWA